MVVWQDINVNMKPSVTQPNKHSSDCVAVVPCAELTDSWVQPYSRQTVTGDWYQSCRLTQRVHKIQSHSRLKTFVN